MMNLVEGAIQQMIDSLKDNVISADELNRANNIENEINNFRNQLKLQNVVDVKSKKYDYQASVTYMDIIVECEKMGDYIINIVETLNDPSAEN
jgi:phosphate:Na+ symporter